MADTFSPSWRDIHLASVALANLLRGVTPRTGIIAVTRGGLVPAAIVSQVLDIRLVDTLCFASYRERSRGELEVLKRASAGGDGRGWLLIDDLVDSGTTAREALRQLPLAHYAVLYAKPAGRPLAHTFHTSIPQDLWVEFPWEKELP